MVTAHQAAHPKIPKKIKTLFAASPRHPCPAGEAGDDEPVATQNQQKPQPQKPSSPLKLAYIQKELRMNTDRFTQIEIAEGESQLAELLDVFKRKGLTGQLPFGARLDKVVHHLAPQNFRALIVTRRDGGWVADLLLHSPLPDSSAYYGSPDVLGTPDALPHPTYGEAVWAGVEMIARLLAYAQTPSALRT